MGTLGSLSLVAIGVVLFKYSYYELYEDHIRVISIFGTEKEVLPFIDIKSWTITSYSKRGGTEYDLTLYTNGHKLKINSGNLARKDFDKLKEKTTANIPEDKRMELEFTLKKSMTSLWMSVVLMIFVVALAVHQNTHNSYTKLIVFSTLYLFYLLLTFHKRHVINPK